MAYNKETGEYEGYIYLITNSVNGKQYVGQTMRTIRQRYSDHIRKSRYNKDNQYLYTAMNKYGIDNFSIEKIEFISCRTKRELLDELNQKETYYISKLNTRKPNGYNMTDGGVLLPNTYVKKPVCNYDLERNFVKEFESIAEAARYYNLSQADITHCCKREKVYMVGGFIWRFKDDDYDVKTIKIPTRVIYQYDLCGNFLNKYNGIQEAERITGIKNICLCCKGKNKSAGGYVWRYAEDPFNKYEVPTFRKVIIYDFNLNYLKSFLNTKEASDYTGLPISDVYNACKKHYAKNGYIWSFEDNKESLKIPRTIKRQKELQQKIYMYDIYGKLLDIFENIDSIPKNYEFNKSDVIDVCRGKYLCYKNKYIFSFYDDFLKTYLYINMLDKNMNIIKTYNTIGELLDDNYDYKAVIKGCKKNELIYGHYWEMNNNIDMKSA